jgi:hypothetical protein
MHVPNAVISLAVEPKDKAGAANFSKALNRFSKEDPTFRVHRDEDKGPPLRRRSDYRSLFKRLIYKFHLKGTGV